MPPQTARLLLCAALAQLCATGSLAAETCRFTGTTNYAGHVALTTTAASVGGITRVGVSLRFEATTPLWLHLRYLVEEISQWRNGTLLRLDANTRYVFAGRVVRQQWDDFQSTSFGLQGYRIEGKRPAEFARQYPRFARHWDLADFGLPWQDDFAAAVPVRRHDLDLARAPHSASLQSPFALAFYWVRFLHPGAQHAQVFLPGFKADKLAELGLAPVAAAAHGQAWRAELHHSYLSVAPPSFATAQVSAGGQLQSLAFELHGSAGSARGGLQLIGCAGTLYP